MPIIILMGSWRRRRASVLPLALLFVLLGSSVRAFDVPQTGALVVAVREGNRSRVEELIAWPVSPNEADDSGMTPLAQAVITGDRDITELLLQAEANPDSSARLDENTRMTPLMLACLFGRDDMAALLLAHDADPNALGAFPGGQSLAVTALSICLDSGLFGIADRLVDAGADAMIIADPDTADNMGRVSALTPVVLESPLTARIWRDRADLADAAYSRDRQVGIMELLEAARLDDWERASELLDDGFAVDRRDTLDVTPLMAAAYHRSDAVFGLLLDRGADPSALDKSGRSALTYAAGGGNLYAVRRLIESGVPANPRDPSPSTALRSTPLYAALIAGERDVAAYLLEAGADPDAYRANGVTPLMIAAWLADYAAVGYLLDPSNPAGAADPNLRDDQGRGAVSWAIQAFQRDRDAGGRIGIDERGSRMYPIVRAVARYGKPPAMVAPWPVTRNNRLSLEELEALAPGRPGGDLTLHRILRDEEPGIPSF